MARYTNYAKICVLIFDYLPHTCSESYGSKEWFYINVMGLNKDFRNLNFAPHSNWTLIRNLLVSKSLSFKNIFCSVNIEATILNGLWSLAAFSSDYPFTKVRFPFPAWPNYPITVLLQISLIAPWETPSQWLIAFLLSKLKGHTSLFITTKLEFSMMWKTFFSHSSSLRAMC